MATYTGGASKTGKPEGCLSLEEVAERLGGITVHTLKQRIKEAGIQPVRPGRTPYLTEDDIKPLIEATRRRKSAYDPRPSVRRAVRSSQVRMARRRREPAPPTLTH
jgi:transposase